MLDYGRAALWHQVCSLSLWIGFLARARRKSSFGTTGFHLFSLSCLLLQAETVRSDLQSNVKWLGWKSAPPSPKSWFSREKVGLSPPGRKRVQPQVEQFLGVLFASEGRMECGINSGSSNAAVVLVCCVEEGVEPKGEALDLMGHYWSPNSQIEVAEVSFLHSMVRHSVKDGMRSSVTSEELRVELVLIQIKRSQLRWSVLEASWMPPQGGVSGMSHCPRWRDYVYL